MCGIVAAIAQRNVAEILLLGLKKLEYRGYDSAGIATIFNNSVNRVRSLGKVKELDDKVKKINLQGTIGIAHTRWATHGKPSENNAHPHVSGKIALVHNGIIENYAELKEDLIKKGYSFESQTDTEVLVHQINEIKNSKNLNLLQAVIETTHVIKGAYGTVIIDTNEQEHLVAARSGSPIVIGVGIGENFVASDEVALLPVTRKFIYLEEGDIADIYKDHIDIYDLTGQKVERKIKESQLQEDEDVKGKYRHFMQKEIYEQRQAIEKTIEGRITPNHFVVESFGADSKSIFKEIKNVKIVACGTSYHAGLVAKYWFEELIGISTDVEIASEFRYRKSVTKEGSLFVTLSQSGETADTLAALRLAKEIGYKTTLSICNVPGSSLVRESDLVFLTRAGREIGVASTKAFTTQLVALLLLVGSIGVAQQKIDENREKELLSSIRKISPAIENVLSKENKIEQVAVELLNKQHCLFLGRGCLYPIAMEGALKLKEISYIHAEAYAAGELKHGPLALVDASMPVIVVAPNNTLLEKIISNIQEVYSRGGILYVFCSSSSNFTQEDCMNIIEVGEYDELISPIVNTIPLQLLSYHVAVMKGTDVDQPRNLAKSVTVE